MRCWGALMGCVDDLRRAANVDDLRRAEVISEALRCRNPRKKRQSNGAAMISGSLRAIPPLVGEAIFARTEIA